MERTMRLVTVLCLLAFLNSERPALAVDTSVLEAQKKRVEVVERVSPTVVAIFGPGGKGGGTGVLISADGYALTNFHVTNGAGTFMKCGLNDGVLYDAVIVSIDPTGDVALIKLLGRNDFPHAPMGDSDKVKVGDWAYAMGNPFLLANDFHPTVTYGIVSGVNRYQYPAGTILEYTDCIQIDTSINPGNSGGPLFNDDGEVIGINGRGSFEKRGRVNSGAGYAISINQIKHFMGHLKSGRIVDHATLGATVTTDFEDRVVIGNILENSEAYYRGLRLDDEIVSFAGRNIGTVNQFKNVLGIYPNGWTVPIVYRRDGQKREVFVKLRALHRKSELTGGKKKPKLPEGKPPEKPGEGPEEKPGEKKLPKPIQIPLPKGPQAPAKYKHMYVKKAGFTNYYFNELKQKELLEHLHQWGDYSELGGTWKLSGADKAGQGFTMEIGNEKLDWTLAGKLVSQPLDGSDLKALPEKSGGLLLAFCHLRLLLATDGKLFTEFYYLGSEPLDGRGEMVDVLTTILTGVRTNFYLSQKDGRLLGFNTQVEQDAEECVVRLESTEKFGEQTFLKAFTVTHGDVEFGTFQVNSAEFPKGKATIGTVKPKAEAVEEAAE